MNVYDFDGTLYKGESCLHFAIYCILRKPQVLKFFPEILNLYKQHKNNILNIEEANELFKRIFNTLSSTEEEFSNLINKFWKKHEKNLNHELVNKMKKNDVIISAGPDFLLKKSPIKNKNIICSEIDIRNKKVLFFCYGENKRKKFKEKYKNKKIDKFYTDSYSDMPLMDLAEEVYLVKKGKGLGIKVLKERGYLCK